MFSFKLNIKEISISAVVKRADGTIEDLGIISYYNFSWLAKVKYNLRRFMYGRRSKNC